MDIHQDNIKTTQIENNPIIIDESDFQQLTTEESSSITKSRLEGRSLLNRKEQNSLNLIKQDDDLILKAQELFSQIP